MTLTAKLEIISTHSAAVLKIIAATPPSGKPDEGFLALEYFLRVYPDSPLKKLIGE
jgi:hypothetical protein